MSSEGGTAHRLMPISCIVQRGVGGGAWTGRGAEELEAAYGAYLGLTLEAGARTSEICGTLKPSYLVERVLRLTSVVTSGT